MAENVNEEHFLLVVQEKGLQELLDTILKASEVCQVFTASRVPIIGTLSYFDDLCHVGARYENRATIPHWPSRIIDSRP